MITLTLDFETAYGKHPVTGENITLSKMTTEEYVRHPEFKILGVGMKWNDRPPAYWMEDWQRLKQLPWHDIALLCQNTMFDAFILSHHFDIHPKFLLDTKSMHKALYPQEPASLSYMAKKHRLGEKGHELVNTKDKWDLTPREHTRLAEYCAFNEDSDLNLTYKLFNILKVGFPLPELRLIDMTIRMFTDPVLELDRDVLEDHLYDVQLKKQKLLASVGADSEDGLKSLRSNLRFADLLRAHDVDPPMKVSPTTGKMTYAFAKSDEGMTALLDHPDIEVQALVEARLGVKSSIEETRTIRFDGIAMRGKLPVGLQVFGAANTLRWAGLEKQNLQNLPRGGPLRRAICAPDGYKLVVADLASIEARVLAWVAGQDDLLEEFRQGADVYCTMAGRVFQRSITKQNKLERQLGKALVLGCGYGMGWLRFGGFLASGPLGAPPILFNVEFADKLGVELYQWVENDDRVLVKEPVIAMEQCAKVTTKLKGDDLLAHAAVSKFLIDMYRRLNKNIKKYWKTGERMLTAMANGQEMEFGCLHTKQDRLYLPSGLSLHYKNLRMVADKDEEGKEHWVYDGLKGRGRDIQYIYGAKLVENIVQALSRVILSEQMLKIDPIYRVVLTVHDETISCVVNHKANDCLKLMIDTMRTPPDWCLDLPLDAEGDIADNYAEAK